MRLNFKDFVLLRVDFSLNDKFTLASTPDEVCPELAINHETREKEKELIVSLGIRQKTGNVPYFFEIICAGLFAVDEIAADVDISRIAKVNCAAILFPYVRETLADLTRRSGHKPLHLPPINFIALANQKAEGKAGNQAEE